MHVANLLALHLALRDFRRRLILSLHLGKHPIFVRDLHRSCPALVRLLLSTLPIIHLAFFYDTCVVLVADGLLA